MTADTRIVPVRDDERAIWSHAHIRRTEPLIARPIQDVVDLGLIASTVVGNCIAANDVRASVAMNQLIDESCGQFVAFVDHDAGR